MSGRTAASQTSRHKFLVAALLLLAVFYCFEAKYAQYGRFGGPRTDVSTAKAFPASSNKSGIQRFQPVDRHTAQLFFPALAVLAMGLLFSLNLLIEQRPAQVPARLAILRWTLNLHRRPPPTL